ncbi:hypothetical protein OK94_01280 [Salmonella enterica]|nr:hypothetical protein [Salmonella enterica]EDR3141120.1 hypothetical protein [Salmonella enterica subsp. enterica serovar Horsham]EAS1874114.1 hypothetical protein [Salmonella enterica]EAX2434213.1 hypothetical protein [Salmonella enterica]EAY0391928.1 hypothetical protein [Salmonella enterica]
MARTRAQRRHHERRLKAIRRHYNNARSCSSTHVGMVYHTPCSCSCWMCGHQRKNHGMNRQEVRARLRYTD